MSDSPAGSRTTVPAIAPASLRRTSGNLPCDNLFTEPIRATLEPTPCGMKRLCPADSTNELAQPKSKRKCQEDGSADVSPNLNLLAITTATSPFRAEALPLAPAEETAVALVVTLYKNNVRTLQAVMNKSLEDHEVLQAAIEKIGEEQNVELAAMKKSYDKDKEALKRSDEKQVALEAELVALQETMKRGVEEHKVALQKEVSDRRQELHGLMNGL